MPLRRCAVLMLEPRERMEFTLALLSGGGTGLNTVIRWTALAPHLDGEIEVTPEEAAFLGVVSPTTWSEVGHLVGSQSREFVISLITKGLLIEQGSRHDERDRLLRAAGWSAPAAVMHYASRWTGVDTDAVERRFMEHAKGGLLAELGPPPPAVLERVSAARRIPLARAERTSLDALLDGRVTCRNFDAASELSQTIFASMLYRAFGARATDEYAPGIELLKKGVPSAGSLHPTEAYLLVQRVQGIDAGLYHYHPIDHALELITPLSEGEAGAYARRFVAGQPYFVDAHVLLVPVCRFRRLFWKYRQHAKAYRAALLDVGHLSQALYIAATELGLGAFITAAVNEVDIESAFGVDPLEEGAIAVCGFGTRAAVLDEIEFDPLHAVWPRP
jgi:putative peptide maturation dehydrogenase